MAKLYVDLIKVRKKSAKQRKHLLLDILATINELSNTKKPWISEPFPDVISPFRAATYLGSFKRPF